MGNIEQPAIAAWHRRRIAPVVVIDEFDLAAEQPALGVDLLGPDLRRQRRRLAGDRKRAGERHGEPDAQRLGRPRRRRGRSGYTPNRGSNRHENYKIAIGWNIDVPGNGDDAVSSS